MTDATMTTFPGITALESTCRFLGHWGFRFTHGKRGRM